MTILNGKPLTWQGTGFYWVRTRTCAKTCAKTAGIPRPMQNTINDSLVETEITPLLEHVPLLVKQTHDVAKLGPTASTSHQPK